MLVKVKGLFCRHSILFSLYGIAITIITISLLSWSQILQPLELNIYDSNFWLRLQEATEERVVIVEWNEENIKALKETIISDRTLSLLLQKIIEQEPRQIGLDLYRDIPVSSPQLSDEENLKSYKSLQKVFRTTDNLFAIEKVLEPIVNPPPILKEKGQVGASDLSMDEDKVVRRTYIYPKTTEDGQAAGLEYLGVRLAYEYLADEKFQAEKYERNTLRIFKEQAQVLLKPLRFLIGSPVDERYSFNILVNWRKANPAFNKISVIEVLNGRVPADFFIDKIVLVGATATSTADRHITPLNRWNQSVVYGVEIKAQVASSIISAALDDRMLIYPAPRLVQFILTVISAGLTLYIFNKNRNIRTINLYFFSFSCIVGISIALIGISLFSMSNGHWLPITSILGNTWVLYFTLNYYLYKVKERQRVALLQAFIGDFNHGLGNRLSSISSSTNRINIFAAEIKEDFQIQAKPALDNGNVMSSSLHTAKSSTDRDNLRKLETIEKRANNIANQVSRIIKYQERIKSFINFGFLNQANRLEKTDINQFITEIVTKFINENEYEYNVEVQQKYDNRLKKMCIDRLALEIVIENLLDNAFYSVSPTPQSQPDYTPVVKISTKYKKQFIEISIEDNGAGIPQSNQQKIFEPFVSFRSGQGIGLFLVDKISRIYGGSIRVESQVGRGSIFTFTIATP